jgi:hypothetical protein
VQLTWPQAARVRLHGGQIYYLRATQAKRWYWFASVEDVLRANPTERMFHRAAEVCLDRQLPRDMMERLHAEALLEDERRDALRARIDALQAHLRSSCFRVIASICSDNTLFVIERLHDAGGTFVYVLPDDDLEALRLVEDLQGIHDRVYQVHRTTSEW